MERSHCAKKCKELQQNERENDPDIICIVKEAEYIIYN